MESRTNDPSGVKKMNSAIWFELTTTILALGDITHFDIIFEFFGCFVRNIFMNFANLYV